MFISYGSIRVLLIEADQGRKTRNSNATSKFFVSVSLAEDEKSKKLCTFSSACYEFSQSFSPSKISEEFLFDRVSSNYNLIITLTIISDTSENSCQRTVIPVSRLSKDVEISQWYQMYPPSPVSSHAKPLKEGSEGELLQSDVCLLEKVSIPQSSIKLQIAYIKTKEDMDAEDNSYHTSEGRAAVTLKEEVVESVVPISSSSCEKKSKLEISSSWEGKTGMCHQENAVIENSRNGGGANDRTDIVLDELEQDREGEGNERMTVGLIDYAILIGPSWEEGGGISFEGDVGSGEGHLSPPPFRDKRSEMHVEYSLDVSGSSRVSAESSIAVDHTKKSSWPPLSPTSPRSSGSSSSRSMEWDMLIWDRFPLEDHEEYPLPAKIEYFACPEGAKLVSALTRPEPLFSSFILSGAGESGEQYGVCLTVFANIQGVNKNKRTDGPSVLHNRDIQIDIGRDCSSQRSPISDSSDGRCRWWKASQASRPEEPLGIAAGEEEEEEEMITWTGVTLCILSRWPLVQQLQQCLLYLYHSSLLPSLFEWEGRCKRLTKEHSVGLPSKIKVDKTRDEYKENENARTKICDIGDIDKIHLSMQPLLLTSQCVELLAKLCLECPVPLWGIFSLDITLPTLTALRPTFSNCASADYRTSNGHHSSLLGYEAPVMDAKMGGDVILSFKQHPVDDLPVCSYSLSSSLFQSLGSLGVLTVLGAALAESKILFLSSDASLLPAACESLRTLLYPLRWAHVYLPVVPAPLLDLVQAPVPFILGTLTKWLSLIPTECLCDVVIVNLDSGAIDSIRTVANTRSELILPFPFKIQTWLLCSIQQVLLRPSSPSLSIKKSPLSTSVPSAHGDTLTCSSSMETLEKDTAIQLLVFDVMVNLLRMVPQCIFSLSTGLTSSSGHSHHVFNRPLFLFECVDMEYRPFLTALTNTNAFERFTESLYTSSMGFFSRAVKHLPHLSPVIATNNKEKNVVSVHPQIHRDVFPLRVDEGLTFTTQNDNFCPEPIISGGDRLNIVQLPAETDNASTVTQLSSTKYRGMLVFPVASPQVSMPFTTAANSMNESLLSNTNLSSTGGCSTTDEYDRGTGSDSFERPLSLEPPAADGSSMDISVDDDSCVLKEESDKEQGTVSAGVCRVDRVASIFPDWIKDLYLRREGMGEKGGGEGLGDFGEGKKRNTPHLALILAMHVIESYYPVLICNRLAQEQPAENDEGEGGGCRGIRYGGYQPGNVTACPLKLIDLVPTPVLSVPLTLSYNREKGFEDEDEVSLLCVSDSEHEKEHGPEVSPTEDQVQAQDQKSLSSLPSAEQRRSFRSPRLMTKRAESAKPEILTEVIKDRFSSTVETTGSSRELTNDGGNSSRNKEQEDIDNDTKHKYEKNKERSVPLGKSPRNRSSTSSTVLKTPPPYQSILSFINKPSPLEIHIPPPSSSSLDLDKYHSHSPTSEHDLDSDADVSPSPPFPLPLLRSSSCPSPTGRVSPLIEGHSPFFSHIAHSTHHPCEDGGVGVTIERRQHSHSRIRSSTFSSVQHTVSMPHSDQDVKVCPPGSTDLFKFSTHKKDSPLLNPDPQVDSSSVIQPNHRGQIDPMQIIVDKEEVPPPAPPPPPSSSCPPLIFDSKAFQLSVEWRNEWTVSQIADAIKVPLRSLQKALEKEREKVSAGYPDLTPYPSNLSSSLSPLADGVKSSGGRVMSPQNRWQLAAPSPFNRATGVEGAIIDYLQYAFSGVHIGSRQLEHLEIRCVTALKTHDVRVNLVYLLRQSTKTTPTDLKNKKSSSSKNISNTGKASLCLPAAAPAGQEEVVGMGMEREVQANLFPLHFSTFKSLSKLYSLAVEACVLECDYVTAYRLLGVGGLYYQIQKSQPDVSCTIAMQRIDTIEETEFLSERVCQHPIFQNPLLWRAALTDRLSTALHLSLEGEGKGNEHHLDVDTVLHEAHALLFIIYRMGINYERAAAFSWLLVSDYSLDKDQCLELMGYTRELYGRQRNAAHSITVIGDFIDNNIASLTGGSVPVPNSAVVDDGGDDSNAIFIDLTQLLPKVRRTHSSSRKLSPLSKTLSFSSMSPGSSSRRIKVERGLSFFGGVDRQGRGEMRRQGSAFKAKSFGYLNEAARGGEEGGEEGGLGGHSGGGTKTETRSVVIEKQKDDEVSQDNLSRSLYNSQINEKNKGGGREVGGSRIKRIKSLFTRKSGGDRADTKQQTTGPAGAPVDRFQYQSAIRPNPPKVPFETRNLSPKSSASFPTSTDLMEAASDSQSENSYSQRSLSFSAGGSVNVSFKNESNHEGEEKKKSYSMIALKGSPSDQVISISTLGQFLIAGLQNGTVNVTDLMSGKLIAKLSHSNSNLIVNNSVTHVQSLLNKNVPPHHESNNSHKIKNRMEDDTDLNKGLTYNQSGGTFATACSGGVVKIWSMEEDLCERQAGGKTQKKRKDKDKDIDRGVNIDNKATILAHEGAPITSLIICINALPSATSNSNEDFEKKKMKMNRENRWIVASGDDKGNIVISHGGWECSKETAPIMSSESGKGVKVPSGADKIQTARRRRYFTNERKKSYDRRCEDGERASASASQNEEVGISFLSMITVLRGTGGVTSLTFATLKGGGEEGRGGGGGAGGGDAASIGQSGVLVAGSSSGLMAVIDITTGQCKYLLRGHTGAVTSIIHLLLPIQLDREKKTAGMDGMLLISCGLDRRLIFWEILPIPDIDIESEHKAGPSFVEGHILGRHRNGFNDTSNCYCTGSASHLPDYQNCHLYSSAGPLTAMLAFPVTAVLPLSLKKDEEKTDFISLHAHVPSSQDEEKEIKQYHVSLAAASSDGSIALWDLRFSHQKAKGIGREEVTGSSFYNPVRILRGHTDRITSMQWKEGGRDGFDVGEGVFQTVSLDGDMRVWGTPTTSTAEKNNVRNLTLSVAHRHSHISMDKYRCCTVVKMFPVGDGHVVTGISLLSTSSHSIDFKDAPRSALQSMTVPSRSLSSLLEKRQVGLEDYKEGDSIDTLGNLENKDKDDTKERSVLAATPGASSSQIITDGDERERDTGISWLVGVSIDGIIKAFSYQHSAPYYSRLSFLEQNGQ